MKSNLPMITEQSRFSSPVVTPQSLAWDGESLWIGSRDLKKICAVDAGTQRVIREEQAPGIPWASVAANGVIRFTIGEGAEDDRYIHTFDPATGFGKDRIACPELTGSYLSFDGENLYLSQWYKHRILKLDAKGNILRKIDIGADVCGHVFVKGFIYVLRGQETPNEDWRIARFDLAQSTPEIADLAVVPFACRSLTFDGQNFWTNHRAADETVSFSIPT